MFERLYLDSLRYLKEHHIVQDFSIASIHRVVRYEFYKKLPIIDFFSDSGIIIKTIKLKGRRNLKKVARSHLNNLVIDFSIQPIAPVEYINIDLEISKQ